MTATEDLRRLLDERGVEWDYGITGSTTTRFSVNGIDLTFTPMRDGLVCSTILTPEQAVEATLGEEPDDVAMLKLHDRMNAVLLEYERALGGEKADGAITVPFVAKMHHLLEEAATLGPCSDSYSCTNDCTNGERTGTCEMEYVSDWMSWHCKSCDHMDMAPRNPKPRYCKWCGRKVVTDG